MRLIADDTARRMKRPWLGPANSWRWPWDASFVQWGVWFALTIISWGALWKIVPVGLLLVVLGLDFGRRLGRLLSPLRPTRAAWLLTGAVWLLAGLLLPRIGFWTSPLPVVAALPLAMLLALFAVRALSPWLGWNRPVTYWLAFLWRTATGPRQSPIQHIDPSGLLLAPETTKDAR